MDALSTVNEIGPGLDDEPEPTPTIAIMAMICEPDGTDRSSRVTLPIDAEDAEIVHALREVAKSAACLRGIPADIADWYAARPNDISHAACVLREWVTRRIVAGRQPNGEECHDLLSRLLRKVTPT